MSFNDKISFYLNISCDGDDFIITPSDVTNLEIELDQQGFKGKVSFWGRESQKDLFSTLRSLETTIVSVGFESVIKVPNDKPNTIIFKGPVYKKIAEERYFKEIADTPVLQCHYELHFRDSASLFWKEHFPSLLLTDCSYSDVIKENSIDEVNVKISWPLFLEKHFLLTLGLSPDIGISYYDFIMWLVDQNGGFLQYSSELNQYLICPIKPPTTNAVKIDYLIVDTVRLIQEQIPRHSSRVLNTYTSDTKKHTIDDLHSVSGIRQDYLIRTNISQDVIRQKDTQKSRQQSSMNKLELVLKEFPWFSFTPGSFVDLSNKSWPEHLHRPSDIMRVDKTIIKCRAENQETGAQLKEHSHQCTLDIKLILEVPEDLSKKTIEYQAPAYPIQVEGKVISEIGKDEDSSFNIYNNSDTNLDYYHVDIPLWNKEIPILFENNYFSPHFFFPAYKNMRVLIDLYFDHAEINRFLDFGPRVRMPLDTQGNQVVMGLNSNSQSVINHKYTNQQPVLTVESNTDTDSEIIRLTEGSILIQTTSESGISSAKSGVNLQPKSEAAKAELKIKSQAGIAEATSFYDDANSDINDELENANADCEEAFNNAEEILEALSKDAKSTIEGAISQLDSASESLFTEYENAKSEFQELIKL
jgi:hypothetical protein